MKKLKKRSFKDLNLNNDGFSLLELVVAVGILLILTVGGLLAYNGIIDNARQAAVEQEASEAYTTTVSYMSGTISYYQWQDTVIDREFYPNTNSLEATPGLEQAVGSGSTGGADYREIYVAFKVPSEVSWEGMTTYEGVKVEVSATYGDKTYTATKGELITNVSP